ncbi:hypothetical protein BASA81_008279 [Batrachochytrium salamandrivorans]|nr:hypothetical protein BASA81_008279 [Batrachochytrium salamandrivorans]
MDFFTIENKIDQGQYRSEHEAFVDLRLVFENALKFNQEGSLIHSQALEFIKVLDSSTPVLPLVSTSKFHKQKLFRHQPSSALNHDNDYYEDGDDVDVDELEESNPLHLRANNHAALMALDKKTVPLFFAHSTKTRSSSSGNLVDPGPAVSSFHFLPDPTLEVLQTVTATGFPLEQISVPCFGHLQSGLPTLVPLKRAKPDFSQFLLVPKHKNDARLFETVYRKFVGELCEKSLSRGLDRIPQCEDVVDLQDYELQLTDVSGEDFRDITSFQMLGDEFELLFGQFATADQLEQFQSDHTVKFHCKIQTYKDIKRMFGLSATRAQLAEGDSDMFCLVREPLLVSFTNANTVTLKAHLVVVPSAELPKEVSKVPSTSSSSRGGVF